MVVGSSAFAMEPPKVDRESLEKKLTGFWYVRDINLPKQKRQKDSVYNTGSLYLSPPTRPNLPKDTGVFTDNENESVQTYGMLVLNVDVKTWCKMLTSSVFVQCFFL